MEEKKIDIKVLLGKPEGYRWKDNKKKWFLDGNILDLSISRKGTELGSQDYIN
jgi:hypothetical protein